MKTKKILSLILLSIIFKAIMVHGQGIEILSGGTIVLSGASTIEINNGSFVNNGTYTKASETFTFSGSTANTMSGSSSTSINNLIIINSGDVRTLFGALNVVNLTILSGAKFSVGSTANLTVSSSITNSAGTGGFILKSDAAGTASLSHDVNNVNATVERYINQAAEAWHFLSSAVSAQNIGGTWLPGGTYGNGTGYDLYLWNEPSNCWIYYLDNTSAINWATTHTETYFIPGKGYLYSAQATNPTKEFAGYLNNGSTNYSLNFVGTDNALKGFNLIGNPYPSSVDWSAASGWTRTDLENSGGGYDMWVWNPTANNYGVYNSADADGLGTNSVTKYIPPMQGFFVKAANSGSISSTNLVRVHNNAGAWLKKNRSENKKICVVVKSNDQYGADEVMLRFGFETNEPGANKLFSQVPTAPSLYFTAENINYTTFNYSETAENQKLSLYFKPGANGNYTLSFGFDTDLFEIIMLEDIQTKTFQNIKLNKTYSFSALTTDKDNRFLLYFEKTAKSAKNELPAAIFSSNKLISIDLSLIEPGTTCWISDMNGRVLYKETLAGGIIHNLKIDLIDRIVVVFLKNSNGAISRKLMLTN